MSQLSSKLALFEGDEMERCGGSGPCVGPAASASRRTLAMAAFETHWKNDETAAGAT